jgi:hypothetical protein
MHYSIHVKSDLGEGFITPDPRYMHVPYREASRFTTAQVLETIDNIITHVYAETQFTISPHLPTGPYHDS